jgi:2,4-dienoyl-CoA reductase (NADPH2)
MLPHGTAMVQGGIPTEEDIAYYAARARGLGLVITGATVATPDAAFRARILTEGWNADARAVMQRRCDVVHAAGAKIVGQLCHLGRESTGMDSEYAPKGPSAIRSPRDPWPPQEMDEGQILAFIDGFATAALNLQAAGYDGVELHAAHGYLFAQFMSEASNHRTDAWGGSMENRTRLVTETVARVRAVCRPDFIIGVRLSADEETADGLGVRDTVGIGQLLAGQGETDYLNITIGMRGAYVKDATHPAAPAARAAGIIRAETGLPVIVGQKIQTPEMAEKLLADGVADLVGMARALIADPGFADKARSGQAARIRPCVGLNQDCRAFSPHLHCSLNPEVGRETRAPFDRITPATPKRLAIIGGGPAGLEAARIATARGHKVTIFEATEALGGQFLLAASLPGRSGLLRMVDHLVDEMRHADVVIRFNTRIDDLSALDADFDEVIVATGALPAGLPDAPGPLPTLSWAEVLRDGAPAPFGSGRAVFADDGTGFWFTYGVAEMLVAAGWHLTLLTTSAALGGHLPHESVAPMLGRLGAGGTDFRVLMAVEATGAGVVTAVNLTSGAEHIIPADLLVVQTGRIVAPHPHKGARPVHAIGDCVTPRRITHALFEAQRLARIL